MAGIVSPHDKIFKSSMTDVRVAREFFETHLSKKILKKINLNKLELCSESYIDENLKLSESDIVYRTEIAGQTAYLYILAEHQSKPDRFMPFRLLKYNIGIWSNYLKQHEDLSIKKLPLIVNLVFYNGKEPYTYSTDFRDLLDASPELVEEIWNKPFKLIDLHEISDEELRRHKWHGIAAFFMKHIYERDFMPYFTQAMDILKILEKEERGDEYIVSLVNYLLAAAEIGNVENFIETIKTGLSEKTGEKIMTGAEQLIEKGKKSGFYEGKQSGFQEGKQSGIQQGMQQGIQQGIQQGMQQGMQHVKELIVFQLNYRFTSIPENYLTFLEKVDHKTLLKISKRIFEAKTISDVFEK